MTVIRNIHNASAAWVWEKSGSERNGVIAHNWGYYGKEKRKKKVGFVYCCRVKNLDGVYKIGATAYVGGVKHRVRYQKDLSLHGIVFSLFLQDPFGLEAFLHNKFANVSTDGKREWFCLSNDDLEFVKGVKLYNGGIVDYLSATETIEWEPSKGVK